MNFRWVKNLKRRPLLPRTVLLLAKSIRYIYCRHHRFLLLILSFKTFEVLKVTTLLPLNKAPSPVCGFRPFLDLLSLTQNLPKPLIRTSSPDSSVCLITSRRNSTAKIDVCFWIWQFSKTEFVRWTLVSVTIVTSIQDALHSVLYGHPDQNFRFKWFVEEWFTIWRTV